MQGESLLLDVSCHQSFKNLCDFHWFRHFSRNTIAIVFYICVA